MDMRTGLAEHYSITIRLTINEVSLLVAEDVKMQRIFTEALKKTVQGNRRY